ncbi:SCP2 domain-containing protein [Moraxella sp. ZY210820]|uniref:ubiquinone biosynthesis accessory factor UbiJ n=1 Tax=unclassified Moraxella TaxID=2685852 RepID=UPI0027315E10|nr:hypothetical protein [Moraxella sp. ZY210820]WLF83253.1 hypothetical protein LU301_08260 [Moraxella sp. ZY210820]
MWSILALGLVEKTINRVIDLDAITRVQCNQLQGKLLRIVIDMPQLSLDVHFDDGKIRLEPTATGQSEKKSIFEQRPYEQAQYSQVATTTLHTQNLVALFKLLLSDEQNVGNIPVQGDYQLLIKLKRILQQTELDLASHLTPFMGASVAHELGKLQRIPKKLWQQSQNTAFAIQDYLKEDSGLFAPRWQMEQIAQQTRQLNQEIDRLEAKLQQLKSQVELQS